MLAMDVNDNAYFLSKRVALESIASKLAPTEGRDARCQGSLYSGMSTKPFVHIWCINSGAPHFRACLKNNSLENYLLKHLFGTMVRKLLLLIGLTLSSNNNSAPQALILVFRD